MTGAPQAPAARRSWSGGDRLLLSDRADRHALAAAVAVAAGGAAAFLWRLLSWSAAATPDAWAYAAWGQAVVRGERPLFELGATTPKPLGVLLGTAVVPLPAERAFPIVVALAAGALAGVVFAAGYREGGAIAAAVGVIALVAAAPLSFSVVSGYVDVVVAALVLTGIALRGRWRIGAFILAGLLRPEAWALAGIAGFTEAAGSLARRAAVAAASAAAAPVLWVIGDLVLTGDPLGTAHWPSESSGDDTLTKVALRAVPDLMWSALRAESGAALVVVGALGLVVHYLRARRRGTADLMPLAVTVIWTLLLALETRYGRGLNARYFLPVVAVLAVGCGLFASAIVPARARLRSPWPAVAVSVVAVLVAIVLADLGTINPRPWEQRRNDAIAATRPAIESALACGKVGTTKKTAARGVIPQLAASSRRSLHEFGIHPEGGPYAAVLQYRVNWRPGRPTDSLPPWPLRETALGPLAVAPRCVPLQGL